MKKVSEYEKLSRRVWSLREVPLRMHNARRFGRWPRLGRRSLMNGGDSCQRNSSVDCHAATTTYNFI